MPFKSKAQMRWMFANHPRMARRWADHTPDIENLPEKADQDDKEDRSKEASFVNPILGFSRALQTALLKQASAVQKVALRQMFASYLDHAASLLPLAKQASVRLVQKEIASGKSIVAAIKKAFPHLSGEERGLLLANMVKGASHYWNALGRSYLRKAAETGDDDDIESFVRDFAGRARVVRGRHMTTSKARDGQGFAKAVEKMCD